MDQPSERPPWYVAHLQTLRAWTIAHHRAAKPAEIDAELDRIFAEGDRRRAAGHTRKETAGKRRFPWPSLAGIPIAFVGGIPLALVAALPAVLRLM